MCRCSQPVGIIFLVPIGLFLLDVCVLLLSNTANDRLANNAARAAASGTDLGSGLGTAIAGFTSAQIVSDSFASSAIINKPASSFLTGYCWNGYGSPDSQGTSWPLNVPKPSAGSVAVITTMVVNLPVPFPLVPKSFEFQAMAVEPIVSITAGAEQIGMVASNSNSNNFGAKAGPGKATTPATNGSPPSANNGLQHSGAFAGGPTAQHSSDAAHSSSASSSPDSHLSSGLPGTGAPHSGDFGPAENRGPSADTGGSGDSTPPQQPN